MTYNVLTGTLIPTHSLTHSTVSKYAGENIFQSFAAPSRSVSRTSAYAGGPKRRRPFVKSYQIQ